LKILLSEAPVRSYNQRRQIQPASTPCAPFGALRYRQDHRRHRS